MSYKPPADFRLSETGFIGKDQKDIELLLIQVPKKFDIKQLNGVEYVPGQILDIMRDDSLPATMSAVYQLASNASQELDLKPLVKHDNELVVGQSISGHLSVTKTYNIETKPSQYTLPSLRRAGPPLVPMPVGLKERFTPFGSGKPFTPKRSATSSDTDSPEKKKKRKKKKDKDRDITPEPSSPTESAEYSNHLRGPTETILKEETETHQEQRKHKKKKHKEKREKFELDIDFASPKLNGSVSFNNSLACPEVKGILSNSVKAKKHSKNVSFSLDESVFMNSSGDADRLDLGPREPVENSEGSSDVNGNSLLMHTETDKKGKKRKRSSGYSSADTSLELSSLSEVPVKRKKKKHKASHTDS